MLDIAVVIPNYQRLSLCKEAIRSVCNQSLAPREIIVVDDGSSSELQEQIRSFCEQQQQSFSGQIEFLPLNQHLGMPGAVRNTGIRQASCEWLAFLDSDDLWLPDKLEKQLASITATEGKILVSHCRESWHRYPNGGAAPFQIVSQRKQKQQRSGWVFHDALHKCIIGPSTLFLHRSCFEQLGYFHEGLELAEDYEFFLRLTANYEVTYHPEELVIKRDQLAPQLSHKYPYIEPFRIEALEIFLDSQNPICKEYYLACIDALLRKLKIMQEGLYKRGKHSQASSAANQINYWKRIRATL